MSFRQAKSTPTSSKNIIEVKSRFHAEFRRFHIQKDPGPSVEEFKVLVADLHHIDDIPFTLGYTDHHGDLLPINNEDNFRKAIQTARPLLRLLLQKKGESWEEQYGYGNNSLKKKNRLSQLIGGGTSGATSRTAQYRLPIGQPQDFRQVSAIIDVDVVPETHRRVRLCKHGSEKPLGFYIRDGSSVRITQHGVEKVPGIFISRMVPGGLAEGTGLLAVNDEVLEVNGIEVSGKTLDQVTDMMVANSSNLIITVKPANQRNTLSSPLRGSTSRSSQGSEARSSYYASNSDDEGDEVKHLIGSARGSQQGGQTNGLGSARGGSSSGASSANGVGTMSARGMGGSRGSADRDHQHHPPPYPRPSDGGSRASPMGAQPAKKSGSGGAKTNINEGSGRGYAN